MDTKGERIEFVRKKRGLSYPKMANLIGTIKGDALRKAIKSDSVKEYYITLISNKLNINEEWILTGNGEWEDVDGSINNPDERMYLEKNGVKIYIKEITRYLDKNEEELKEREEDYRLWWADKINNGMFRFFKEHGIEVRVNNKEEG
ncbi:helix-turn-helix domain-containing protein [Aquimarina macrocephali]|uniref:hypothetical protein n=1 Tax=Aquimarina macrocephali TaxID=666563 RepID=UPI0004653086|nr:hypothetical protein [Aquimarina macrocephali]